MKHNFNAVALDDTLSAYIKLTEFRFLKRNYMTFAIKQKIKYLLFLTMYMGSFLFLMNVVMLFLGVSIAKFIEISYIYFALLSFAVFLFLPVNVKSVFEYIYFLQLINIKILSILIMSLSIKFGQHFNLIDFFKNNKLSEELLKYPFNGLIYLALTVLFSIFLESSKFIINGEKNNE